MLSANWSVLFGFHGNICFSFSRPKAIYAINYQNNMEIKVIEAWPEFQTNLNKNQTSNLEIFSELTDGTIKV